MSRSYKHTPVFGNTSARSEKSYKTAMHRIERARVRNAIANGDYETIETELAPYNAWDAPKDGKGYVINFYPSSGFGIHHDCHRWSIGWTKDHCDKLYRKALRK